MPYVFLPSPIEDSLSLKGHTGRILKDNLVFVSLIGMIDLPEEAIEANRLYEAKKIRGST